MHPDYKGTRMSACGTHRVRTAVLGRGHSSGLSIVFLTDSKQHARPGAADVEQAALEAEAALNVVDRQALAALEKRAAALAAAGASHCRQGQGHGHGHGRAPLVAIAQSLRAGVQVVTAPQLFPIPEPLAERMAREADIPRGS